MSLYLLMLALLHYYDVNVLSYKYDFSAHISGLNNLLSSQIYKSDIHLAIALFIFLIQYNIK